MSNVQEKNTTTFSETFFRFIDYVEKHKDSMIFIHIGLQMYHFKLKSILEYLEQQAQKTPEMSLMVLFRDNQRAIERWITNEFSTFVSDFQQTYNFEQGLFLHESPILSHTSIEYINQMMKHSPSLQSACHEFFQTIHDLINRQAPLEASDLLLHLIPFVGKFLSVSISPVQSPPQLGVKLLVPSAKLPTRINKNDAGCDLSASEETVIKARSNSIVKTGISIVLPPGTYARIAPRSSLAAKHSIDVGAGVIDEGYTSEVGVVLFNHGDKDFIVNIGDRIAQLIVTPILFPEIKQIVTLPTTERGDRGFGSSGR